MVDTNVTEITKVGTPLRSFVMNIAGLAFLVVTWQQLLGDNTSTWQTTITMVGAALSLAVIVALYISRKAQIAKFVADQEEGKKILPTEEEASEAEADDEEAAEEEVEEPPEEEPAEEMQEVIEEVEKPPEEEVSEEDSVDTFEDTDATEEDSSEE